LSKIAWTCKPRVAYGLATTHKLGFYRKKALPTQLANKLLNKLVLKKFSCPEA